jgi:hypothetical protein
MNPESGHLADTNQALTNMIEKLVFEAMRSTEEKVKDLIDIYKDTLANLESDKAHEVKLSIAEMEHQRELLKINLETQVEIAKSNMELRQSLAMDPYDKAERLNQHRNERYNYHRNRLTPTFWLETKSVREKADALAESDMEEYERRVDEEQEKNIILMMGENVDQLTGQRSIYLQNVTPSEKEDDE